LKQIVSAANNYLIIVGMPSCSVCMAGIAQFFGFPHLHCRVCKMARLSNFIAGGGIRWNV
jgi:hypothetical protein